MRRVPALLVQFRHLPVLLFAGATTLLAFEPPGYELVLQPARSGLPVVVAHAGGQELRLAIDTGTSISLVSAEAAERLSLVPHARFTLASAGGEPQTAHCGTPPTLRIAGVDIVLDCLGWVPEERRLAGAEDVDGLLGSDAIAQLDLWIDTRRGRARIAPPGTLLPWTEGVRIPVDAIERRPAILLELFSGGRGGVARLVIDSGADGAVLFGELARRARTTLGHLRMPGRVECATTSVETTIVPLGTVRAGGVSFDGGLAGLMPQITDRVEQGLLPLAALGPVLLDLSGGVMVARARLRARPRAVSG
ncbi:MAG TPA: aspartyl protease family protein [Thermoanaerobaculia bacterium]|nr:aspartyl protease family protein [Thermoanaerobaculia bacterium]